MPGGDAGQPVAGVDSPPAADVGWRLEHLY